MASKHVNSIIDAGDFERLRRENTSLREQLNNLRDEVADERQTHKQLLESFKLSHNEDARKLLEERRISNSLVEEIEELRAEVNSLRHSAVSSTDRKMENRDLVKLLIPLGKKISVFHNDLLSSPFLKNIQGETVSKQGKFFGFILKLFFNMILEI